MIVSPTPDPLDQASLGTLLGRLVDDGKTFARAEIDVQVATIKARVNRSKLAVALFGGALLLVIAAVVVLVASLGALIAFALGLAGAGLAAAGGALGAVAALLIALICVKVATRSLAAASKETLA